MPVHKPIYNIQVVDGVSVAIDLTAYYESYYVYGTATLSTNWAVTGTGTPTSGMRVLFEYNGTVTLSGNHITFLGTQMPDDYASKKVNVDCYYNGSAWVVDYQPAFDETDIISSTQIKDNAITTAKILAANVTLDKLEALASGYIVVGNGSNRPTAVAVTGDITVSNAGVTAIGTGVIVNADINASAAIGLSKLAALTASVVPVTDASGFLTSSATTTTELARLAGVTAGTVAASKVVVPDADKNIDQIVITNLYLGSGAGTQVTSTAAELNILDGVTATTAEVNTLADVVAGTVTANKAVIVGASKQVDTLDIASLKLDSVAVTAAAADLNKLTSFSGNVGHAELVISKTSAVNYVMTGSEDVVQADTSANQVTATLPLGSGLTTGKQFIFKRTSSSNDFVIQCSGSDAIITKTTSEVSSLTLTTSAYITTLYWDGVDFQEL